MSGIRIKLADSADEREALYAFRYRIYVEEMNRPQKYADHDRRRICDPLDAAALNIIALDDDIIVGCLRSNLGRDGGLEYYERLLAIKDVGVDHPYRTSVSTRLMVVPEHRHTPLAHRLFAFNFDLGVAHHIRWNFIDCNDHLVEFFSRFGFVRTHSAEHEEYGQVNAMRIDLEDEAYLRSIKSPFVRKLTAGVAPGQYAEPVAVHV